MLGDWQMSQKMLENTNWIQLAFIFFPNLYPEINSC